jgi:predicted nucleotidyltransferase
MMLDGILNEDVALPDVVKALNDAGVDFVLVGGHAIGGWTKKPRATVDVDVVIASNDHAKAVEAIKQRFPELVMHDLPVVTRFAPPGVSHHESKVDLMKPGGDQAIIKAALTNNIETSIEGQKVRIPDLEMAIAMKYASMVGVYRKMADKYQDATDFMRMVQANQGDIDMDKLRSLGKLVHSDGDKEIIEYVSNVLTGKSIVI